MELIRQQKYLFISLETLGILGGENKATYGWMLGDIQMASYLAD